MLIIGLTGGIGSGKTTVAKIFEVLGIPVYYADEEAKRIMNEDETIRSKLIVLFGEETYINGKLNRSHIASIVFKDTKKLDQLNAIVHPVTIADSDRWMQSQNTLYAIKEAALIFESGSYKKLDYVIGVSSPVDLRIQRVINRDKISKSEVERRIHNQMPEKEKMKRCHFVIVNDEAQLMMPQVLKVHNKLVQGLKFKV
jgi:dephospho-CoA kinase